MMIPSTIIDDFFILEKKLYEIVLIVVEDREKVIFSLEFCLTAKGE